MSETPDIERGMHDPVASPGSAPTPDRRQLSLTLPLPASFGPDDLVRGPCNEQALTLLDGWPNWPHPIVYLSGPLASGKTHIGTIWAARAGAHVCTASRLSFDWVAKTGPGPVFVDNLFGGPLDEASLFHLINRQAENSDALVLAARLPPDAAPVQLADLRSRLRAALAITIDPPDDSVLEAVLIKLFADRQLDVAPATVRYALARMNRSFEAAGDLVSQIDRITLEEKRRVTIPVVVKALSHST